MSSSSDSSPFVEQAARVGRWLENTVLTILLFGMIILATVQVLLRDFGAGSLVWADEAVRLMVLWLAMVGGIAAAREDRHISIDVLSRFLPRRVRAATAVLIDLFTIVVCLALTWYGWVMIRFALEDGDRLLGGLPAWPFQAIIPVAFACMAWRYFVWLLRHSREALSADLNS